MAVQYEYQEIPFGVGIGEDVAEYAKNAPMLETLANGRITKSGSITPRDGYSTYGDALNLPKRILALKDQLVVVDTNGASSTNNVNAYIKQLSYIGTTPTWVKQGTGDSVDGLTEATIMERRPIARSEWEQGDPDVAIDITNQWALITWQETSGANIGSASTNVIFATILDLNTWAVIQPPQQVSAGLGSKPRAMRCTTTAGTVAAMQVVYAKEASNQIRAIAWTKAGGWGTDTAIISDLHTDNLWDAVALEASGQETALGTWFLAYKDTTPRLNYARCSELATTHTGNIAEVPTVVGMHANSTDTTLWLGWFVLATGIRVASFGTTALAAGLAATTLHAFAGGTIWNIGAVRIAANKAIFTYTGAPSATHRPTAYFRTITSAGTAGTAGSRYSLGYLSRPEIVNGTIYANVLYDNGSNGSSAGFPIGRDSRGFATAFTVAVTDTGDASTATARYSFRSVATWMMSFAGSRRSISTLSQFRLTHSNEYCFTHKNEIRQKATDLPSNPVVVGVNGLDLCRIKFDASDRFKAVEFGGCLVFTGGQTMIYDGRSIAEYGFFWPPEGTFAKDTAGGSLSAGEYSVSAIWEYRLNTGDIMRSAPSIVCENSTGSDTVTATANHYFEIDSHPLNLTQKFNGKNGQHLTYAPLLQIYRSEANGEVLYLDTCSNATTGSQTNNVFADDTNACIVHIGAVADTPPGLTDASIITQEMLYTTGGILPNYPLPATDDLIVHRNRLWGISSEDKKTLMFTHVKEDGEMPGWHPFLVLRLEDGGDCIALASLDDKLIVFKEDSIWVVYGNGPDRKGTNSDLQIQKIPIDHGCDERRSLANIPAGIMFQSSRGICLLDRKLQVQFVGGPVMDEVIAAREIVAAVTLPQVLRVYFLQRTIAFPSQGQILVYHWDSNQWSVDTLGFSETISGIAGGVNIASQFYLLGANNYVNKEGSGTDPIGTCPIMALQTAWIPVGGGKQGYGRCRWVTLLGKKFQDYALAISFYQDRITSAATQSVVLQAADINAMYALQPKFHVSQQRCQEIRAQVLIQGSTDCRCVELTGLGLDIGTKRGVGRLPDANMRG